MPRARLHSDQVDIDESVVRRLLEEQMEEYADLPLRFVPSGGTDNAVYRLGEELAVRMPLRPGSVGGLLKEIRWLPVLAPHLTLAVPEIVRTGRPGDGYPFVWAVVRWLPGADALTAGIGSMRDAALALGRFVTELRGVDTADMPAPGSEGFIRGLPLIGREETFRDALAQCEGLVDLDLVVMRELWEDALAAPDWAGPPVWLHGDLLPTNLLVRDGRVAGVLDFGAMATGDPAYDVTPAWQVLDREHRPLFRRIVEADDATWRRARGLVVSGAVITFPYYLHTNPTMVALARRGIAEVLADLA